MATRRVFAYSKWNINFLKVGGQKRKKRSLAAAKQNKNEVLLCRSAV